jgi:NAD-dependent DNA ligase
MLGLAKGVLADGVVADEEAALLRDWVQQHPDAIGCWPIDRLAERLEQIFADGVVDETERRDLTELLQSIVGGEAGLVLGEDAATDLPLDRPAPDIRWTGSVFVCTGKFAFGPRPACEDQVRRSGGICEPRITRRTDYLVIGTFASRDWIQTSFGRKIEKAVQYRDRGSLRAIVGEDHWASSLP